MTEKQLHKKEFTLINYEHVLAKIIFANLWLQKYGIVFLKLQFKKENYGNIKKIVLSFVLFNFEFETNLMVAINKKP